MSYEYDAANRLKVVTTWLGEKTTYFYDISGKVDFTENANDTITDYSFDNANRLVKLVDKKSTGEVISEQI